MLFRSRMVDGARLGAVATLFGRSIDQCSRIINTTSDFIYERWSCLLLRSNEALLSDLEELERWAEAFVDKGSVLDMIIALMDAQLSAITRPTRLQRHVGLPTFPAWSFKLTL